MALHQDKLGISTVFWMNDNPCPTYYRPWWICWEIISQGICQEEVLYLIQFIYVWLSHHIYEIWFTGEIFRYRTTAKRNREHIYSPEIYPRISLSTKCSNCYVRKWISVFFFQSNGLLTKLHHRKCIKIPIFVTMSINVNASQLHMVLT